MLSPEFVLLTSFSTVCPENRHQTHFMVNDLMRHSKPLKDRMEVYPGTSCPDTRTKAVDGGGDGRGQCASQWSGVEGVPQK